MSKSLAVLIAAARPATASINTLVLEILASRSPRRAFQQSPARHIVSAPLRARQGGRLQRPVFVHVLLEVQREEDDDVDLAGRAVAQHVSEVV